MAALTGKATFVASTAVLAVVSVGLGVQLHEAREEAEGKILSAKVDLKASQRDIDRLQAQLTDARRRAEMRDLLMSRIEPAGELPRSNGDWTDKLIEAMRREAANAKPKPGVRVGFHDFLAGDVWKTGKLDPAEVARLKSIAEESGDPRLRLAVAGLLPLNEVVDQLKKAAAASPDDLRARLALAEETLKDPAFDVDCAEAIREARRIDPENGYADFLDAARLAARGDPEGAAAALAAAVGKDAFDPRKGTEIAAREELFRLGGYSEGPRLALASLQGRVADLRNLPEGLWEHASRLTDTGRIETAEAIYRNLDALGARQQSNARSIVEDLLAISLRKKTLERLADIQEMNGRTQELSLTRDAIERLEARRGRIRELCQTMDPTPVIKSEEAMVRYFRSVFLDGELSTARAFQARW